MSVGIGNRESSLSPPQRTPKPFVYPSSDGKRMAENTEQFNEIVRLKENFEIIYEDDPNVFVAGDLLWYPVERDIKIRQAPDTMIAFGRPKGYRGSYVQCQEGGIAPQVVFEVLSPGNRKGEMQRKLEFYERYGVEEYYVYDPDRGRLRVWLRQDDQLGEHKLENGVWTSPRTHVRMDITSGKLRCWQPNGEPFRSMQEFNALKRDAQAANTQLQTANTQLQTANTHLQSENAQLQAEKERTDAQTARLKALLKAAGIDPDAIA